MTSFVASRLIILTLGLLVITTSTHYFNCPGVVGVLNCNENLRNYANVLINDKNQILNAYLYIFQRNAGSIFVKFSFKLKKIRTFAISCSTIPHFVNTQQILFCFVYILDFFKFAE